MGSRGQRLGGCRVGRGDGRGGERSPSPPSPSSSPRGASPARGCSRALGPSSQAPAHRHHAPPCLSSVPCCCHLHGKPPAPSPVQPGPSGEGGGACPARAGGAVPAPGEGGREGTAHAATATRGTARLSTREPARHSSGHCFFPGHSFFGFYGSDSARQPPHAQCACKGTALGTIPKSGRRGNAAVRPAGSTPSCTHGCSIYLSRPHPAQPPVRAPFLAIPEQDTLFPLAGGRREAVASRGCSPSTRAHLSAPGRRSLPPACREGAAGCCGEDARPAPR